MKRTTKKNSLSLFLFISIFLLLQIDEITSKYYPLEPITAQNIANFVLEPSGLTFCESTGHLYAICDRHQCDYIYEMQTDGTPVRRLKYDKSSHDDVEAVACYDEAGLLYIAEEEKRRITVFKLEDYDYHKDEYYLKEVTSFYVAEDGKYLDGSGIEGLTVNTKTGEVYVANEKNPIILFHLSADYVLQDRYYPTFSSDISDLFYDSELDLLWILSDKSESLFVTSLDASKVYDEWKLPMKNAEGIAIDNTVTPKMLYIATDPSSPQGAQYVAALYSFYKPEIGTGRLTNNIPPNPPIDCEGCSTIEEEAQANQEKFDHAMHVRIATEIIASLLVSLAILAFVLVIIVIFLTGVRQVVRRKSKSKGDTKDDDKTPFSLGDNDGDFGVEEGVITSTDVLNNQKEDIPATGFFARLFGMKKKGSPEYLMVPLNQESI